MKTNNKAKWMAAGLLMLSHIYVGAQQGVALLQNKSSIKIQGTSSLHDWEEDVQEFDVNLKLVMTDNKVSDIRDVSVVMKSASIESGNSIMNSKTHSALKADQHPEIEFKLITVDNLIKQGHNFTGVVTGDLTIAGKTKRIKLDFQGSNGGKIITIKGSKEFKMSEFNIDPPTALMGTLKTADEITISFNLQFLLS